MTDRPRVSFIVMSYMAEKFIREAVRGALAQTYRDMEIIFSDDASSDRTYEIIQEELAVCKKNHHVRVFRNEKNMGLSAHLNRLWYEIARGEWIVVSAGDDVSYSNRVERLMEFAEPGVAAIHHYIDMVNDNSEIVEVKDQYSAVERGLDMNSVEYTIDKNLYLIGSSMCLNSQMLKMFGPFSVGVVNEDNVLAYRAQFFGRVILLKERLMMYRKHSGSISLVPDTTKFKNYCNHLRKSSRNFVAYYNQVMIDNRVLNLSARSTRSVRHKMRNAEIDFFLYSGYGFKWVFLVTASFYFRLLKRLFLRPYLYLRHNRFRNAQV